MYDGRVTLADLPTPCVVIERGRLRANLDRMQALATAAGVRLRPHAKTHKSPRVAQWQIERGAVGICCAKLGEAEVFAAEGIGDIRIPYPLQPALAPRVLPLLGRTRLSFIVDDLEVARVWSRLLVAAGRRVEMLVKVDVGFHRCGLDPSRPDAVDAIAAIAALPGLEFRGLLSHAGHAYHAPDAAALEAMAQAEEATLTTLADALEARGIAVAELSAGATPPARFSLRPGTRLTEFRPGNYVYVDRTMVGLGAATLDDCALSVVATVVSAPTADRLVLDSGSKTLSSDAARGFTPLPGYGSVFRDLVFRQGLAHDAGLLVERLSEEHATVRVKSTAAPPLRPGDRVRLVPNHACVVSNLVEEAWLVDGATVLEPLPIPARGRIQ